METIKNEEISVLLRNKRRELGLTQKQLGDLLSVHEKTIRNWENGNNIPESKMKQITNFINGEEGVTENMVSTSEGVPFYNVDFELGFDLMVNDQTAVPEYLINFAPYNKCTAWCTASGNSMLPTISGGDMISLKKIEDFTYLISGEIYALITRNGLRTVKRVKDNGDSFTLIPDNKDYYEQTLPKEEFTHVFQVMGAMKRF